jgi:hypothetical protein
MSGPIEPATPFWEGYKRTPEQTANLVAALSTALYTYDTMRVGQFLVNLARGDDLFNMWDEELLSRIENPWWVT